MPKYEFQCKSCQCMIELMLPVDERDNVQLCEECGHSMVRLLSTPAIRFIGGGFYSNGG